MIFILNNDSFLFFYEGDFLSHMLKNAAIENYFMFRIYKLYHLRLKRNTMSHKIGIE